MRGIHLLTDKEIQNAKPSDMLRDGGGLFVQIRLTKAGVVSKSGIFRFERDGNDRHMGMGAWPAVSLATMRELAAEARDKLAHGINPLDERKAARLEKKLAAARERTFDQCVAEFVAKNKGGWKNPKHIYEWKASLERYVSPTFGKHPVQTIDNPIIQRALEPIWHDLYETAKRIRSRVERVLDYAEARGYRLAGNNPARRGLIEAALGKQPGPSKRVKHHATLPYQDLPAFMVELRKRTAIAARCLEFAILTVARTGEVIGCRWDEIDLANRLWIVPHARMKSGREHSVVLSDPAVRLLEQMQDLRDGDYVFSSAPGTPMSDRTMLTLLERMGYAGTATVHGLCRATFKTWATEATSFEAGVVEFALAHTQGKLDLSYMRGTMVERRRALMQAWSRFVNGESERQQAAG
jgi:integrase